MEPGLSIPNVGEGDTKLSFDPNKPVERERACRIVNDMLRRGYAIMVVVVGKSGKKYTRRVKGFDPKQCEYLIDRLSPEEEADIADQLAGRDKRDRNRVPAARTPAVAVARTARGCTAASWT